MNKKGIDTRTILWVFYILLVLIMTYFLYNFIDDTASGKGFSKKYFVNDLGLTFDALPSANHDLEITYNNLEDYDINIGKENIKIQDESQAYNYVRDNNLNIYNGGITIKNNNQLMISKNGNVISIYVKGPIEGKGGEFGGSASARY